MNNQEEIDLARRIVVALEAIAEQATRIADYLAHEDERPHDRAAAAWAPTAYEYKDHSGD